MVKQKEDLVSPNMLLRQQRIQHNWRQQDIADQLEVSLVTVQRWEQGKQQPSAYYRSKLCTLFNLSVQELGLIETAASPSEVILTTTTQPENAGTLPLSEELSLWTIPYARNPHFSGRDDLLHHLAQQFASEQSDQITNQVALTQLQIIKGLGGIGKTQIVVEYAYRAYGEGRYTHAFWVTAASEEALLTSFATIADLLPTTHTAREHEKDQRQLVTHVLHWLEGCTQPWLLIIDNADDLDLVQPYLPLRGNGHILLTTQASAVGSLASSIEMDNMGIDEGTQFLLRRAQRIVNASPAEIECAREIVVALAQFPLALDQAGAYIEETGCSFATYLQIYQDHHHALLAKRGRQTTNYPASVAATWSLALQQLEQTNPAATQLLHLCAFLPPDHIPEELLTKGAAHWPLELQQATTDPFAFNQLFQDLLTFSLVKRLTKDRMLSLHRLVQIVQMGSMEPEEHYLWAERVIHAVHIIFPDNPTNATIWPLCLRYLELAMTCHRLIQQHHLLLPEAAEVLERAGIYLREQASYHLAEPLLQHALHIRMQQMGSQHLDTASSLNNLGLLYLFCGKRDQSEPLFLQALSIRTEQLNPHHPAIAECLHSLGLLYLFQGKAEQAESLLQRALFIIEQQVEPMQEKLAECLHNLGDVYRLHDKHLLAEPFYQRALALWEQLFGPGNPRAIKSLVGLADLYITQGKYAKAESLYLQILAIREQQYGPDHPLEAYTSTVLADLYIELGRYDEAERLHEHALQIWEHRSGPQHPNMGGTLEGLAILYRNQGKHEPATSLFRRSLAIRERIFVSTHPVLAKTRHEFAILQHTQGHYDEARSLYELALTARTKTLGTTHPHTIQTRTRLIALLREIGHGEEADTMENVANGLISFEA